MKRSAALNACLECREYGEYALMHIQDMRNNPTDIFIALEILEGVILQVVSAARKGVEACTQDATASGSARNIY